MSLQAYQQDAYDNWPATDIAGAGGPAEEALPVYEMTTRRYIISLVALIVAIVAVIVPTTLAGIPFIGLTVCGIGFALLVVLRMELSLFVLVALIPWEIQTALHPQFTLVKAAGMFVAVLGLIHILRQAGPKWPTAMKFALWFGVFAFFSSLANLTGFSVINFITLASNLMLMYLLVRFCAKPEALRALILIVGFSCAAFAMYGVVLYGLRYDPTHWDTHRFRLGSGGESEGPNVFVRLVAIGVFLMPILLIQARNQFLRVLCLLLAGACLIATILTVSRVAMAGIIIGGLVVLLTMREISPGMKLATVVLAAILGLSAVFIARSRFSAGTTWAKRMDTTLMQAAQNRFWRWQAALKIFQTNPVLGVGLGNQPLGYFKLGLRPTEAHNDLISALVMVGPPGLFCFLALWVACTLGLWRLPGGITRSCLLGMWVTLMICSLANPALTKKVFWLAVAICLATISCYRRYSYVISASGPVGSEDLHGEPAT